jgi:hypothetical protein
LLSLFFWLNRGAVPSVLEKDEALKMEIPVVGAVGSMTRLCIRSGVEIAIGLRVFVVVLARWSFEFWFGELWSSLVGCPLDCNFIRGFSESSMFLRRSNSCIIGLKEALRLIDQKGGGPTLGC